MSSSSEPDLLWHGSRLRDTVFQTCVNSGLLYLAIMSLGKTWLLKACALCAAWTLRFCLFFLYDEPYYLLQSLRG